MDLKQVIADDVDHSLEIPWRFLLVFHLFYTLECELY